MIPYNRQSISKQDIDSVVDILQSDFLTQGPMLPQFEGAIEAYTGAKYSVAVSSGTAALHLAYLALDLSSGDIVWSSAISFVATTNAAIYCGADVDFVDIDIDTGCICIHKLEKKLIKTDKRKHPKVVVVVDYAGHCPDMKGLGRLAKEYGFKVVEDACHALGGKYKDKKVGACSYSDITVFSFHPIKTITTGEGGAITTNSREIANRIKILRSHGIVRPEVSRYPWVYEQKNIGFNYRLTDIQAALGISQLKRIDEFITSRLKMADYYKARINEEIKVVESISCTSSFHLFSILLPSRMGIKDVSNLFKLMKDSNVIVQKHYIPIYMQPFYIEKYGEIKLQETERFYDRQISLPLFVDMENNEADKVINVLNKYMKS